MVRKIKAPETTQAPAAAEVREPTFSLEQLNAIVAQAVAEALTKRKSETKSDQSAKNEWQAVKAFKKAGFADVQPHVNVMTYNRWIEQGRKVKQGEHAVRVKQLRLFHISQTEPITAKEKAELQERKDAAVTAQKAKIVSITEAANP
jgi:hypothetical protein